MGNCMPKGPEKPAKGLAQQEEIGCRAGSQPA